MVAVAMLKKLGYWVEVVSNGLEAIEALRKAPYDLVLMDCQMPELDGYDATRLIRAGEQGVPNPSLPIIAMTAYAMIGDREKCLAAGMDDYVGKPIYRPDLVRVLDKFLDPPSVLYSQNEPAQHKPY